MQARSSIRELTLELGLFGRAIGRGHTRFGVIRVWCLSVQSAVFGVHSEEYFAVPVQEWASSFDVGCCEFYSRRACHRLAEGTCSVPGAKLGH